MSLAAVCVSASDSYVKAISDLFNLSEREPAHFHNQYLFFTESPTFPLKSRHCWQSKWGEVTPHFFGSFAFFCPGDAMIESIQIDY